MIASRNTDGRGPLLANMAGLGNGIQRAVGLLVLVLLAMLTGCGVSTGEPGMAYGEPNDWKGRNSVAGSSILKNVLSSSNRRVHKFSYLSDRLNRVDTIVWIPTDIDEPPMEVLDWFEGWLAGSPNRTLVYLGRDSNPGEDYWRLAAAKADPTMATEYLREAALLAASNDAMRSRVGDLAYCRWFVIDNRKPVETLQGWKGPWADQYGTEEGEVKMRGRLVPVHDIRARDLDAEYKEREKQAAKNSVTVVGPTKPTNPGATPAGSSTSDSMSPKSTGSTPAGPTPASDVKDNEQPTADDEAEKSDSSEDADSTNSAKATPATSPNATPAPAAQPAPATPPFSWMMPQPAKPSWTTEKANVKDFLFEPLLETKDGFPFIFQIRKEDWPASRILIVNQAGPFLNLGMTDRNNRDLSDALINELTYSSRIGMIVGPHNIRIDDGNASDQERPFGLLTTWPLNLITLHAAFFGLLILIALFPVFGRARSVPAVSTQDFGNHIQALGDLLSSTGDREYALSAVANYFRTVRGDSSSPWSQIDKLSTQAQSSPASQPAPPPAAPSAVGPTAEKPNQPQIPTSPFQRDLPKSGDQS